MSAPDFICIGAQKAGTSWLFNHLWRHPKLTFARDAAGGFVKEVNFFTPGIRSVRFPDAPKTDDWYLSLFQPGPGQIAGDMSPHYARLAAEDIAHVRRIAPRARILYILRHPVERDWSAIRMRMSQEGGPVERWLPMFETDPTQQSYYLDHLARWRAQFGDQVTVLFFDALLESPAAFYAQVCAVLGIDPAERSADIGLQDKIFEGPAIPCPPEAQRRLEALYRPTVIGCHALFANCFTARWLESLAAGKP